MAEMWLLVKVGYFIKGLVWSGYACAGGYFAKTSIQYVKDYKEVMRKEGN